MYVGWVVSRLGFFREGCLRAPKFFGEEFNQQINL